MDLVITLAIPATKADGSTPESASDFANINLYRANGTAAATLIGTVDPKILTYTDKGLSPGAYGYSATGVDALGRESAHGDVVPFVVPAPPPLLSPPTVVGVTAAS